MSFSLDRPGHLIATTVDTEVIVYASADPKTAAAVFEGVCPLCAERLTPVPAVEGIAAGRCPNHGVGAASRRDLDG